MELVLPVLVSETLSNIRDIALIAVLLLLFLVLFGLAILGIVLFRQMRRLASRADNALSRVESGIEKFENATDTVSSFAGTLTSALSGAGLRGVTRIFQKWFGTADEEERKDAPGEPSSGPAERPDETRPT